MTPNSPGCPPDPLPVPQVGAAEGALRPPNLPSAAQQQGLKFQKVIARFVASSRTRPYVAGAALGSVALSALQMFKGGFIGEAIGMSDVPLGGLVVLGAFAGSAVFGGVANIVGALWNALGIPYRWRLGELWITYRLGRISPKQYFELGAVLDYQRHCGHLPPEARPKAQADFVYEAVRWRMDSKKKRGVRKRGSHKPRSPAGSEGKPSG